MEDMVSRCCRELRRLCLHGDDDVSDDEHWRSASSIDKYDNDSMACMDLWRFEQWSLMMDIGCCCSD